MRIAHASDIHWTTDVPLGRLPGKRILGTANQILRGRRHHFPRAVQQSLVQHLLEQRLDLFILTGDLTAQALPEEFAMAREDLQPVLDTIPTVVLPGNHDVYTQGAKRADRIAELFGPWLHRQGPIGRFDLKNTTVFTLDPNRPTWIHASGEVPTEQLEALSKALEGADLEGRFIVLALHYPVLDRHGEVYDGNHHGLLNARALIDRLKRARHAPHVILHGHEHHGYTVPLDLGGRTATLIDCGSSGYKHMPEKRRAAATVTLEVEGTAFTVERYLHDGTGFAAEPGGAFATGR